jgi:hypothetical protein
MTDTADIIVGEFPLNSRDIVRVSIGVFNGNPVIAARKWFRPSEDGEAKPTPKGLTIALRHLPMLAALTSAALDRARADGLIEPTQSEGG